MSQLNFYFKFITKVTGQCICSIHAPMLTAGAAKAHHQAFKITFDKVFHRGINKIKDTVQVVGHMCLLLEIVFYRLITAMLRFEFFDPAGVKNSAAVKYKTTAVAGIIPRYFLSI